MKFFSTKILLIIIISFAIIILGSYIFLSKPDTATPQPLPVQQMTPYSPSPFSDRKTPVAPLPSFSPPVVPYEQLTQEQKEQYQTQSDEYYQKTQDTILKNYHWYLKLPLQGKGYFVYFDPPSERFKAALYPQKNSSVSIENQIDNLKNIVIQQIATLGADASRYQIDWEIIQK